MLATRLRVPLLLASKWDERLWAFDWDVAWNHAWVSPRENSAASPKEHTVPLPSLSSIQVVRTCPYTEVVIRRSFPTSADYPKWGAAGRGAAPCDYPKWGAQAAYRETLAGSVPLVG